MHGVRYLLEEEPSTGGLSNLQVDGVPVTAQEVMLETDGELVEHLEDASFDDYGLSEEGGFINGSLALDTTLVPEQEVVVSSSPTHDLMY